MIRHHHYTIRRLQRRVQVGNARHCQTIVVKGRHMWVMVIYHSTFLLQKMNDIKCGGFAQVADIFLVGDTQYQYRATFLRPRICNHGLHGFFSFNLCKSVKSVVKYFTTDWWALPTHTAHGLARIFWF